MQMNLPLNIDWQQILLHLFNFVILFAVLYFLLYNPVKKFMDQRTGQYQQMEDEANAKLAEAAKTQEAYVKKLAEAEDEIAAQKEQARKELEAVYTARVQQAAADAEKILADARQNGEKEREKLLADARKEVAGMVASATEKLVLQASTGESYDQFLNAVERGEDHGEARP